MLPRQNLAESAASRSLPARPRDRDHHPADFRRRSLVRAFLRVMVGWRSTGVDILLRPGNLDAFILPPSSCLLVGAIPPSSASPHEAAVSRDVAHATRPDATAFPSRRAGRGRSSSDKYRLSIRHRDALSPADARSCEPIRGPGNLGGIDRERSPDRPTECRSNPPTERSDAWLVGGAVIAPGRSGIVRRREIARGGSGLTRERFVGPTSARIAQAAIDDGRSRTGRVCRSCRWRSGRRRSSRHRPADAPALLRAPVGHRWLGGRTAEPITPVGSGPLLLPRDTTPLGVSTTRNRAKTIVPVPTSLAASDARVRSKSGSASCLPSDGRRETSRRRGSESEDDASRVWPSRVAQDRMGQDDLSTGRSKS